MANIGNATLTITPKFDNLSASINSALGAANVTSGSRTVGGTIASGIGGGMLSSAAIFGAFSSITNRAISSIGSHVGTAVARLDTLKAYPRVMESLGYSSEEANDSIRKMSERLSTLPTTLDSMTSTVQGIAAITGDLGQATDVGLALNDMLLASGSSTQLTTAAMEQFRQMLAKGKPEMQDWKSLTQAMPGQMNQLAESLLGAGASASDLYAALGGGGAEATITMDQLMDAMVRLDEQGGASFESFADQAETASGGIGTALANMSNAVTRGLADVMDSIGQTTISGAIDGIKSGITQAFSVASDLAGVVTPAISEVIGVVGDLAPVIATAVAAFAGFSAARSIVGGLGSAFGSASEGLMRLAGFLQPSGGALLDMATAADSLGGALSGPVGIGLALVSAAVVACVADMAAYNKKMGEFDESLDAVSDGAVVASESIGTLADAASKASGKVSGAAMSVSDLTDWNNQLADSLSQATQSASDQMAELDYAQGIIDQYANKSGLSADQQTLLKDAIDTVNAAGGEQYSVVDAANGVIEDQSGKIQENTDAIDENIAALKRQLQVQALSQNYQVAYAAQIEAQTNYERALAEFQGADAGDMQAYTRLKENLDAARETLANTTETVDAYGRALGEATGDTETFSDASSNLHDNLELATAVFGDGTEDMDAFRSALADAGISWEQFGSLSRDTASGLVEAFNDGELSLSELNDALVELNATPLEDKEGSVSVDDSELTAANGQILVWENGRLVDKYTKAVADSTTVRDGNGNIYVWNGSTLKRISGIAAADTSSIETGVKRVNAWNALKLVSKRASAIIAWAQSGTGSGKAAGGIRAHADGGVRYHASGAIATKAVPLDIVGEDGAEAIVPLTNRRYSQPFVDLIAEGVGERLGGAAGGTTYNTYIDGDAMATDAKLAAAIEGLVGAVQRRANMA